MLEKKGKETVDVGPGEKRKREEKMTHNNSTRDDHVIEMGGAKRLIFC